MLKKIFLGLSLALIPSVAMASSCSDCSESCNCKESGVCNCDKESCDCTDC